MGRGEHPRQNHHKNVISGKYYVISYGCWIFKQMKTYHLRLITYDLNNVILENVREYLLPFHQ